jgi:hypothetical protein
VTRELGLDGEVVETDYSARAEPARRGSLLSSPDRPSAIVFDSDLLAVTGLGVAQQMGFAVPEDLSIVGWDDSLISQVVHPPLTAITRDIGAYGLAAARHLLAVIDGEAPGDIETVRAELTIRGSTGDRACRPPLNASPGSDWREVHLTLNRISDGLSRRRCMTRAISPTDGAAGTPMHVEVRGARGRAGSSAHRPAGPRGNERSNANVTTQRGKGVGLGLDRPRRRGRGTSLGAAGAGAKQSSTLGSLPARPDDVHEREPVVAEHRSESGEELGLRDRARRFVYETPFRYDPLKDKFIPWLASSGKWTSPNTYSMAVRPTSSGVTARR